MKPLAATLMIVLAAACARDAARPAKKPQRVVKAEIQTIDSTDPRPAPMQPPPVLSDDAPAPKSLNPVQPQDVPALTPQDEKVRAQLPFAPAIGLDPVDGSKISIRANTPTFELKGHVFYFSSEENKRTFMVNPQQYMVGPFKHVL
jgi:YHS domain-containing protein